jgi:hypothetical protein
MVDMEGEVVIEKEVDNLAVFITVVQNCILFGCALSCLFIIMSIEYSDEHNTIQLIHVGACFFPM